MKDEIIKIAGSRTKGFTKKQIQDILQKFNLKLDWNSFYRKIHKYDLGLYFDKGSWHYDEAKYYTDYIELIHKTDDIYFGMAMGAASQFVRDNRNLIKEVFPLEDFAGKEN